MTHLEAAVTEDTPIDPRDLSPDDLIARGYERGSRGDAIRAYCVNVCMCGSRNEVLMCANGGCPLWLYRMGTDPWREKKEVSDEARAAAAERFRAFREAKSAP